MNKEDNKTFNFFSGVSSKILGIIAIVLIISLSLLGVVVNNYVSDGVENLANGRNQTTLNYLKSEIQGFLSRSANIIDGITYNKNFTSYSNQEMRNLFENLKEKYTQFRWIYFGTNEGEMIMYPNDSLPDDYDPRERGWYKKAVNKGEITWSEPYQDASTNEYLITAAVPIK